MPEREDLRAAFDDLRSTALPAVRPPGVAAAYTTLSRRRTARAVGAAVGLTVVAVVVGALLATGYQAAPPPADNGVTPGPVDPSPTGSADADQPQATATAKPRRPPRTARPHRPPPTPTCQPQAQVVVSQDGDGILATAQPATENQVGGLCPGVQVRVFWATYRVDDEQVQRLHASQAYTLDAQQPSVRFTLDLRAGCRSYYVASGDDEIRGTIGPGENPYANTLLSDPPPASCPAD
jgi:hypothetical protein